MKKKCAETTKSLQYQIACKDFWISLLVLNALVALCIGVLDTYRYTTLIKEEVTEKDRKTFLVCETTQSLEISPYYFIWIHCFFISCV